MDRLIKIATIPLLIAIGVLAYMTLTPPASSGGAGAPTGGEAAAPGSQDAEPDDGVGIPVDIGEAMTIDLSSDQQGPTPDAGEDDDSDLPNQFKNTDAIRELGPFIPLPQVEKRGTGPVNMILVAGNGETWEIWDAFMERNAERYTMWAVTLPGFGGGELPPIGLEEDGWLRRPWIKNAGRAIMGLIAMEGIDDTVLVGHQIGGHIALYVGLVKPDWLNSVISIDGEPRFLLGDPKFRMTVQDRHRMVKTMMSPQFATMTPKQWSERQRIIPEEYIRDPERGRAIGEIISQAPMQAMHQYIKEIAVSDLSPNLGDAKIPMLFVAPFYHIEDESFRTDREVRWFDMLGDAPGEVQVVFFYNSSSWVTEDQPDYLDEAIRAFLSGEEPVGSPPFDPFGDESATLDDE